MVLSKRERVFRVLELDGEPDMVPIHSLGFEPTSTAFQTYLKSKEKEKFTTWVKTSVSRKKFLLTEQRFWNVDAKEIDPFGQFKIKIRMVKDPPGYPGCRLNAMNGKLHKNVNQIETGMSYTWYVGGYFTTPERLYEYWDRYGRPSELVNDRINYSPQLWESFVDALSEYFYPMAVIPISPHESLFEGITIARVQYYMRKKPQFIHQVMGEYAKANVEIVKRFAEAGVEVAWLYDDLGSKESSIFSPKAFREFILPYYKQIYQACKKYGMLIIQHSCGYVDKLLPDMVDAGLNGIQALEPAAGVDLAGIKETLGDRLCLIGGMDSSRVLNFGTPKDVEEDVKKCIKAAARGGGYFAGPSHNILNVPWENVLALRAAIEKYRKYPLNV